MNITFRFFFVTKFVIGRMDSGDTDLKKTFDIEQMALIGKMHNMQWLKSNSQLSGQYVRIYFIHFNLLCYFAFLYYPYVVASVTSSSIA